MASAQKLKLKYMIEKKHKYLSQTQFHVRTLFWNTNINSCFKYTLAKQPPSSSHKHKYLSQTQFQVQTQPQVLFSNTNSRLKYKLTDRPTTTTNVLNIWNHDWFIMFPNLWQRLQAAESKVSSRQKFLVWSYFSLYPIFVTTITTAGCAKKNDEYQVCFSPNHFKFKVEILSKLKKPTTTDIKKRQIPTSSWRSSHGRSFKKKVLNKHIQKGPKVQNLVIVTLSFKWHKLKKGL